VTGRIYRGNLMNSTINTVKAWDGGEKFGWEQEANGDPQSQRRLASSQVLGEVLQSWRMIVVFVNNPGIFRFLYCSSILILTFKTENVFGLFEGSSLLEIRSPPPSGSPRLL